jgi:cyclic pyranopterin phosphate synthase
MTARRPAARTSSRLTHIAPDGSVRMVDVGAKPATRRRAVAEARLKLSPAAFAALRAGTIAKGDALTTAQIAGIAAAKKTSELIPLCHPVPLTHVAVMLTLHGRGEVRIRCETAVDCPEGETCQPVPTSGGQSYGVCTASPSR